MVLLAFSTNSFEFLSEFIELIDLLRLFLFFNLFTFFLNFIFPLLLEFSDKVLPDSKLLFNTVLLDFRLLESSFLWLVLWLFLWLVAPFPLVFLLLLLLFELINSFIFILLSFSISKSSLLLLLLSVFLTFEVFVLLVSFVDELVPFISLWILSKIIFKSFVIAGLNSFILL